MSSIQDYAVTGMTCGHRVTAVTEEVQEIPGVEHVEVVLETGRGGPSSSSQTDENQDGRSGDEH